MNATMTHGKCGGTRATTGIMPHPISIDINDREIRQEAGRASSLRCTAVSGKPKAVSRAFEDNFPEDAVSLSSMLSCGL
jgi:hypothetical protein